MSATATILRPSDELRDRLLPVLAQAGVAVGDGDVLPLETSDDEVIAALRHRRSHLLVIPFRQQAQDGVRTHGLELLHRLEREAPEPGRAPVLLLVTLYSAGAVRLMLGEANPDETLTRETRHRILVMQEEELGEPKTPSLLQMHLRMHAPRPRAAPQSPRT
jgi:hypothetical protein